MKTYLHRSADGSYIQAPYQRDENDPVLSNINQVYYKM